MANRGRRDSFNYPAEGWLRCAALINYTVETSHEDNAAAFVESCNSEVKNPANHITESTLSNIRRGVMVLPRILDKIAHAIEIPYSAPDESVPNQRFTPKELSAVAYNTLRPRVTELDPKPRLAAAIDKILKERGQGLHDIANATGLTIYRVLRLYCLGGWAEISPETEYGRQSMDEFLRLAMWVDGNSKATKTLYQSLVGQPYPESHAAPKSENGVH